MGRSKKTPWNLTQRKGSRVFQVEFRHPGGRHRESTGSEDPRAAEAEAARIYTEVISGRRERSATRKAAARVGATKLDVLFAEWLASLENTLDVTTVRNYEMYVAAHFLPFFSTLDHVTTASCSDYTRARLAKVMAKTVRKEQSAMRGFIAWCVERGHIDEDEAPVVRPVPKRATGTPSESRRKIGGWIKLTPDEASRIIAALPEHGRRNRPHRAYVEVLWETGLRPETLCSIKAPTDYKRGATSLLIRDEADKARFGRDLPLSERARAVLDSVCPDAGYLFARTPRGTPPDITNELRKAARLAGLETDRADRISPYDFRHGRATEWVRQSSDLGGTAFLLGHKQATTTNHYFHPGKHMAERVLRKAAAAAPSLSVAESVDGEDDGSAHARGAATIVALSSSEPSAPAAEPTTFVSRDSGHSLATLTVSAERAASTPDANSPTSIECEEQDLNLHTLRYRNLNPARLPFRHPRMSVAAQGRGFAALLGCCQERAIAA
jgi:integrase